MVRSAAKRKQKRRPKNSLYKSSDSERFANVGLRASVGLEKHRSEFRRDYARLIHCPAFRRLQGKTQVFPGAESDFFRNRLTHSLEVAQIAKSIAIRLNCRESFFRANPIDVDIVETAGLAHDLGHPPFGHNGEKALDDCMKNIGGFEGNAQTLRIVARLEKKDLVDPKENEPIGELGEDRRLGLNLTFRTLAALVKYDRVIPISRRKNEKVKKGVYKSEAEILRTIKEKVCKSHVNSGKFKTVECYIMDVADDIAYSTYDLEDTFKADFLRPLDILTSGKELLKRVAKKVSDEIEKPFSIEDTLKTLNDIFQPLFRIEHSMNPWHAALKASRTSAQLATNGYTRTQFTAELVSEFIAGVEVEVDAKNPPMSRVFLRENVRVKVEVLKHFTYEATIMHPRLQIVELRGYEIVCKIFEKLVADGDAKLLPSDCRALYEAFSDDADRRRVVCDFIAGMTDRYALEFFGRMYSENPQTIFKPY